MWKRSFTRKVLEHRIAVVALAAGISAVAGIYSARVGLESSIEIWFLEDDSTLTSYHQFLDRFDADEFTVVGLFAEDVFAPNVIEAVRWMTERAREAPHAHRVISLATVPVIEPVDGGIAIEPFLPEAGGPEASPAKLAARAARSRWITQTLVSPHEGATAVVVELSPAGNTVAGKTAMVEALREAAREMKRFGVEVRLAGSPVFDEAFFRYSQRDMVVFGLAGALLVIAILAFVFRHVVAVAVPVAVVLIANLWIYGVMGALAIDFNVVSIMLGALILAIGVADTVHLVAEYTRQLGIGRERTEAVREATAQVIEPCLFTTLTTAMGLLALLSSDLRPIAQFGWLAALGVGFAFLLSVTLAPALLSLAPPPSAAFVDRQRSGLLGRCLARLGRPSSRSSWSVIVGAAALAAMACLGLSRLAVGSNPINYLMEGDPVREDFEVVDERLGGSTSAEFLVRAPDGGLLEPDLLQRLEGLQRWISGMPGIGPTLSIVDALKVMNRAMHGGDPSKTSLPRTRAQAAQQALFLEGRDDFDAFVQDEYSIGRISARVKLSDADEAISHMEEVEDRLAREFRGLPLELEPTGLIQLMAKVDQYVLWSQIRSFVIAFLAITPVMMLLLRSLRLGLFAMIPNLSPLLIGLGFMGYATIALDPGTAMIASVALGLVVDDSVHFLHRVREHSREGTSLEAAIRASMESTGRPIVVTSLVLAAGYGVLGLGSFAPNVYFGIVTALVVLVALVAALVVLPAALLLVRPRIGAARREVPIAGEAGTSAGMGRGG